MSLFPQAPPEESDRVVLRRDMAPRWVFGRICKKKGRHIRVLKGGPDAPVLCVAYPLAR